MPVAQPEAPKCPPFASLCECNKNHYYLISFNREFIIIIVVANKRPLEQSKPQSILLA